MQSRKPEGAESAKWECGEKRMRQCIGDAEPADVGHCGLIIPPFDYVIAVIAMPCLQTTRLSIPIPFPVIFTNKTREIEVLILYNRLNAHADKSCPSRSAKQIMKHICGHVCQFCGSTRTRPHVVVQ